MNGTDAQLNGNGGRFRRDSVYAAVISLLGIVVSGIVGWEFGEHSAVVRMQTQIEDIKQTVIELRTDQRTFERQQSTQDSAITMSVQRLNALEETAREMRTIELRARNGK